LEKRKETFKKRKRNYGTRTKINKPGEHVWRIQNIDTNVDVVLSVDSDGKITTVKRSPLSDVELTFTGYNSKMDYVLVDDILNSVDTDALSRRKEAITTKSNFRCYSYTY